MILISSEKYFPVDQSLQRKEMIEITKPAAVHRSGHANLKQINAV
jgi:hypothetical protein